tara:strand:+ start:299 stop:649 length:351 start_codon:yes stop_codon:yes gene_type:complete
MFKYPESMVDNSTNYNNMERMEEGIIPNKRNESVGRLKERESLFGEDMERSTDATLPPGLAEINESEKFFYIKKDKTKVCGVECRFRNIVLSMFLFIVIGTGVTILACWLIDEGFI